jgi:hypothetical protein
MSTANITFETVREIGLALPDVEASTMYASPALKVRGKLLTCVPVNKSAEPGSLAVALDPEHRSALLEEAPRTYYVTDHYADHPIVLVRLSEIGREELAGLLNSAWRFVTAPARQTARGSAGGRLNPSRRKPR